MAQIGGVGMTRPRHGTKPLPAKTRAVLADAQTRMTIRMLLANGATETPMGAETWLAMPGSTMSQRFPTDLVASVKQDAERWPSERRLAPSEEKANG